MAENCIVSDGGSKMIRSSSSSSISYISGLSDELLVEILGRLGSPKYATRCKCICKRWFSLIDTNSPCSYFLRRWLRINGTGNKEREEDEKLPVAILSQFLFWLNKSNYSFNSDQELQFHGSLDFLPLLHPIRCILGTFRDIVLCCPCTTNHNVYYICNPFTRQWTALPPPPPLPSYFSHPYTRAGLFVSEDEGYGFIFNVVRVTSTNSGGTCRVIVDIYSSDDRAGGWRQVIEPEIRDIYHVSTARPIYYNGMMVWLGEGVECFTGLRINPIDPKGVKSYFSIPYPEGYEIRGGYDTDRPRFLIGVCMGCLRIARLVNYHQNGNDCLKLFVWELDRHSESSWELVHELDFSEIDQDSTDSSRNESNARFNYSVMAFHPHDGDILYLYLVPPLTAECIFEVDSPVFLCNARKRTLKVIGGHPTTCKCVAFPLLLPAWPTPVPLLFNPTRNPPPLPIGVYSWKQTRKLFPQSQSALPTEP